VRKQRFGRLKRNYGQRWQVEAVSSMIKRRLGSALRARVEANQFREIVLRAITHNVMIIRIQVFYRAGPPHNRGGRAMNPGSRTIDLNADLGEGYANDPALLTRVTSASISCGAHAGDDETIRTTLREAYARNVQVGAHPGYPDREGFGRRELPMTATAVDWLILSQFAHLDALAKQVGLTLRYVKPHGALYNQAQRQEEIAEGVIAALQQLGLPVLGQPGSILEARARAGGVRFISEGFPDRRYRPDGRLVGRGEPGAILLDPAEIEAQVVRLVEEGIIQTLCIHGDDPRAVANAETVRAALERHGIETRRF
jgi:UPF0271 protein